MDAFAFLLESRSLKNFRQISPVVQNHLKQKKKSPESKSEFIIRNLAVNFVLTTEYLYLGGFLSSGLCILVWLQFASYIFEGSAAIFMFRLYFGLLVFVGYVVFDTQEIIEKAHLGDLDYVKHALNLFSDFVAVFVRILYIMLEKSAEKNEKKKKRRDC